MGPIEAEIYQRVKAAKWALFNNGFELVEDIEPGPIRAEYDFEPRDQGAAWVQAMRVDDSTKAWQARVFITDIQREVCSFFKVSKKDLLSHRRNRSIVRPRQIGMYLAKVLTERSLPEIGRRFGDRDHTTVLHAVRKVTALIASDPQFACEVNEIRRRIGG